jgi:hypothetical protein
VTDANASTKARSTNTAWENGRVSTDQARLLFRLTDAVPEEYRSAEDALIGIIEPLSVRDTAAALEYWRQSVDGPTDTDTQTTRRGVSLSRCMDGMRRIDGWMTDIASEALETALGALMPPPGPDEDRSPRQRRHDALEDLARWFLDSGTGPLNGAEKPHIMVMADLDALAGIAGGTHETIRRQVLTVAKVRELACDATVSRIVLGPESEILDVGRKTRVWPASIRRAIIARDRHCTAPGCDRGPQWCDIHHIIHWGDHGNTSVDNGRLLCRFHHRLQHTQEAQERSTARRKPRADAPPPDPSSDPQNPPRTRIQSEPPVAEEASLA